MGHLKARLNMLHMFTLSVAAAEVRWQIGKQLASSQKL